MSQPTSSPSTPVVIQERFRGPPSSGNGGYVAGLLGKEIAGGNLTMSQIDPAELSPGEFIWQIRTEVAERGARVVVIDSLSGFLNSMAGENDLILHLHELLSYLNPAWIGGHDALAGGCQLPRGHGSSAAVF